MNASSLPRIALTQGDVAGVGPEIIARAVTDPRLTAVCRPIVVGDPGVLERALRLTGQDRAVQVVTMPDEVVWNTTSLPCWNPSSANLRQVSDGAVHAEAGQAAYDCLVAATRATLQGQFDAITTAPLNKAGLYAAGFSDPGHTEILARECHVDAFAMMLYLPPGEPLRSPWGLGVAHVTLHTSIRSVPNLLTTPHILETITLVNGFLKRLGCGNPRVGVCALNPHGGEGGLFGNEEHELIAPAVAEAIQSGINATGPIPADALLRRAVHGDFDGVAAMYHDQGHIALKLIGFERAVNVTLGLPIVRTSPSHGTAYDIAWKGVARAEGFLEAVRTAATLVATA